MKDVSIYFLGLGFNDICQAIIKIYDGNKLITNKKTYNNKVDVCLKEGCIYKIVAEGPFETIKRKLIVNCNQKKYYYTFSNIYYRPSNQSRIITLKLTDANYVNLPIAKGEMIIWQK